MNKQVRRYQIWGLLLSFLVLVVSTSVLFQQKLPNDQIELAQSDGSFVYEANLTTLPRWGQTFVPRQAGLRGIYLPLTVKALQRDGHLILHLRETPEATQDLRTATLAVSALTGQGLARFSFAPLPDSFNKRYYFFIEAEGQGEAALEFHYGAGGTYNEGALYLEGVPQDLQANFFLAYDRSLLLRDWAGRLLRFILYFFILLLLALLPGGALLIWLFPDTVTELAGPDQQLNHIEWLALAAGLSVAVYPILLLWVGAVGLRVGPIAMFFILGLSGLGVLLKLFLTRPTQSPDSAASERRLYQRLPLAQTIRDTLLPLPILLFWLIFFLSAAVRFGVIRGQAMPVWQDSYHHAMISQLMVDKGGLFQSWAPYAPIESLSYHFGFHTFVAAYHWLTGADIFRSVLVAGQFMNLLAVPAAFLLGRRFGGSHWAGTFAALITGLLSEYPMYYLNWGRYPQLTGQVILAVALVLTWFLLKAPLKQQARDYRLLTLTVLLVAGLGLAHYRVFLFYPCFGLPLVGLRLWPEKWRFGAVKELAFRLSWLGSAGLVVIAPWLWQVVGSRLWNNTLQFFTPAATKSEFVQNLTASTPSIFDYAPPLIVILALIGVIWGSWQRKDEILLIVGWGVVLFVMANPHLVNLPGAGIITYFAVLIAAYIPLSVLAGFALAEVVGRVIASRPIVTVSVSLLVGVVAVLGAAQRASTFEPERAMVTNPDLAAMAWIKQHTPPEATFWVNARLAYGDTNVVGTDAGWWIPLLTQRHGEILPMIAGSEITTPLDYSNKIHDLYTKFQAVEPASFEAWQILRRAGVTHVYVGQRRGTVWQGLEKPLDPAVLEQSDYYELVYRQDQVRIFALVP